jgi:hypothetical protein
LSRAWGDCSGFSPGRPTSIWLRIVLVSASVLFIVELEKALVRRRYSAARQRAGQPAAEGNPR